jgi:hypothetical protein
MAAAAANVEDSIIAVLTKRAEGCYTDVLQKAVGCSMEHMVGSLNKLLTNVRELNHSKSHPGKPPFLAYRTV